MFRSIDNCFWCMVDLFVRRRFWTHTHTRTPHPTPPHATRLMNRRTVRQTLFFQGLLSTCRLPSSGRLEVPDFCLLPQAGFSGRLEVQFLFVSKPEAFWVFESPNFWPFWRDGVIGNFFLYTVADGPFSPYVKKIFVLPSYLDGVRH